jgi:adenine-specific DNA-methyltransferase
LLRDLLAKDGSIWVTIDDHEAHYLKVLMDEVFGRKNFVANVIWQKVYSIKGSAQHLSDMHDHIHVFSKDKSSWVANLIPRSEKSTSLFKNPDKDHRGPWRAGPLAARNHYSLGTYAITCPSGRVIAGPPTGSYWRVSHEKLMQMDREGRIWWGKDGNNVPAPKIFLQEVSEGITPSTLWRHEEVGHNQDAKRESLALFGTTVFGTPKPESLMQRIMHIATKPGDLILDSFLGSGTTAAVAHKMGRRYIGIEMGEHAKTHCIPRIEKVIAGEQGGISESVAWAGGGGFRFCTLGDTAFDEDGRINEGVKFATLAAFIWHFETGAPGTQKFDSPFLGVHNGTAYYLLFNGILGDRKPAGGNVLTRDVLEAIYKVFPHDGPKVVFGEISRLGPARLASEKITFKQIPYDVSVR